MAWKISDKLDKKTDPRLVPELGAVRRGRPTASRRPRRRSSARRPSAPRRRSSRSPGPRRWCWWRWSSSPTRTRTTRRASPGYDPTVQPGGEGELAARWNYVRDQLVATDDADPGGRGRSSSFPGDGQAVRPERRQRAGVAGRHGGQPRAERADPHAGFAVQRGQGLAVHPRRRLPDLHHAQPRRPGRGRGGGRRDGGRQPDGGPAGQPAGRAGRGRSRAPAGCSPTTAATTARAPTTPGSTTTRRARPPASAGTRPAPRSRCTRWPPRSRRASR